MNELEAQREIEILRSLVRVLADELHIAVSTAQARGLGQNLSALSAIWSAREVLGDKTMPGAVGV